MNVGNHRKISETPQRGAKEMREILEELSTNLRVAGDNRAARSHYPYFRQHGEAIH